MKLVAVQINSSSSWRENKKKLEALWLQIPAQRPCIVVLPENVAVCGDKQVYEKNAEILGDGQIQAYLMAKAKALNIHLVVGSIPIRDQQTACLYSASLVYNPQGRRIADYFKLHLFDATVDDNLTRYCESDIFTPGEDVCSVALSSGIRLGLSICYDLRFPELYRLLRGEGVQLFAVPGAFTWITGKAHLSVLLRARAIENQCYLIAANQCGTDKLGRRTFGHSMIIDPWGEVLASLEEEEGIIIADFDQQRLDSVRARMPIITHTRFKPGWRVEC